MKGKKGNVPPTHQKSAHVDLTDKHLTQDKPKLSHADLFSLAAKVDTSDPSKLSKEDRELIEALSETTLGQNGEPHPKPEPERRIRRRYL